MKTEMKMFASLPLYIVTALFAFGCVSALPRVHKQNPRILPSVPKQDSPSVYSHSQEHCLPGWSPFKDHCYHAAKPAETWEKAQNYCKSYDASLVSINSAEENEFVRTLVEDTGRPNGWTGLKAALNWDDSQDLDYGNWASGEPSGQATKPCVLMSSDGGWKSYRCEVGGDVAIVCKMPKSI